MEFRERLHLSALLSLGLGVFGLISGSFRGFISSLAFYNLSRTLSRVIRSALSHTLIPIIARFDWKRRLHG